MKSALYRPVGRLHSPLPGSNSISVKQIFVFCFFQIITNLSRHTVMCFTCWGVGRGETPAVGQMDWPSFAFSHG